MKEKIDVLKEVVLELDYFPDNLEPAPMLPKCTLTDAELVAKIDEWNGKLCKTGGRAWCLSVPPDPNKDPDLLIAQLCKRFKDLAGL
jgi:hypothetical protein